MKIIAVEIKQVDLALSRPYSIAYQEVSKVENVLVILRTDTEAIGLGVAAPAESVIGESVEACYQALGQQDFAWLIGKEIKFFQQLCYEVYQRFPQSIGSRAALDIALHDLYAQSLRKSLVELWGQKVEALPTSVTIGIKDTRATLEEAEEYLDKGFRVLKVKLGAEAAAEVERLRRLRRYAGQRTKIRIDLNQAYSLAEFEEFYRLSHRLGLELIEQPLPAADYALLRALPLSVKRKIALDESLKDELTAFKLAQRPLPCGIWNIKLMKTGGLTEARKIMAIAQRSSLRLMWGCNDESCISITAALHLAYSSPLTQYIDLDGSLDLAQDVAHGGFYIEKGKMYLQPAQSGLGVRLIA